MASSSWSDCSSRGQAATTAYGEGRNRTACGSGLRLKTAVRGAVSVIFGASPDQGRPCCRKRLTFGRVSHRSAHAPFSSHGVRGTRYHRKDADDPERTPASVTLL